MEKDFFKNLLFLASQKIGSARTLLPYFAAIVFGLGLSRFANAMAVAAFTDQNAAAITSQAGGQKRTVKSRQSPVDLMSILDGPIMKRAPIEERAIEEVIPEEVKNFSLIGTLEGHPSFARAVLQIIGENSPPQEYAIGQKIGAATLIDIGREKIWVRIGGEKVELKVGETTQQLAQQNTQTNVAAGGTITKVLSRQEVNEKILGNPNAIYTGAAFGPNLINGQIDGYKIHRVNNDHVFYSLGARSGDIIKSVNGYPLSDTERMFELWKSIQTMPRVEVVILRNGQLVKFDFHIRN